MLKGAYNDMCIASLEGRRGDDPREDAESHRAGNRFSVLARGREGDPREASERRLLVSGWGFFVLCWRGW